MNLSLLDFLKLSEEIESPQYYASKIKEIDDFYGYLAWSEVLIRSQAGINKEKSEGILNELMQAYPSRPEVYIKLWYHYYSSKLYPEAISVAETAFLKLAEYSGEYSIVINLNYARSLFKMEKYRSCLELLQMMYTQNSQHSVYLYHYGRMCLKSKDTLFLGSAIGALEECLKTCGEYRHANIYYWLVEGYLMGNDKVQAFNYAKVGIGILSVIVDKSAEYSYAEKPQHRKNLNRLNHMKTIVKEMHIDILNIGVLEKILSNYDKKNAEEAKIHCKNIMKFDPVEGNIFNAKLLYAKGDLDSAIELLHKTMKINTLRMKSFFILAQILFKTSRIDYLEKICKEMMKRCKNPIIPVQVWIETHMIYIKSLILKGEYEKSILILKSLAQVQPSPFIPDLNYTKHLQFSTSKNQLINTIESLNISCFNGDDFHNNMILRAKLLFSGRNLSSIVIDSDNESEIALAANEINEEFLEIGSRAPEPMPKARISRTPIGDAVNTGFSVSISYKFLYLIGKIAARYNVCIEDGYYAIHDFLNIHHYWMREGFEKDEKMQVKAQYWLGVLLYLKKDFEQAEHIFKDIMSMLFQLNLEKMSSQVLKYLKEIQGS